MANSYFQFKEFTVNQEKSAMKVCTDACLFGAYISSREKNTTNNETNMLDIGTGTGLLSLMMAQKLSGNIDAVEIDEAAYKQASENFKKSTWKTRLSVFHADITKFALSKKYDLIVSNPPFFNNSLKSNIKQRNIAKHTTFLSYAGLVSVVCSHLANNGRFYVLLPYAAFEVFEKNAAENQLAMIRKTDIRPKASSECFRTIGVFTNAAVDTVTSALISIKDSNNEYTSAFVQLLKDYYLYL